MPETTEQQGRPVDEFVPRVAMPLKRILVASRMQKGVGKIFITLIANTLTYKESVFHPPSSVCALGVVGV